MSGLRLNFASTFTHQSFKFIFSFYKIPSLSMPKFRKNVLWLKTKFSRLRYFKVYLSFVARPLF